MKLRSQDSLDSLDSVDSIDDVTTSSDELNQQTENSGKSKEEEEMKKSVEGRNPKDKGVEPAGIDGGGQEKGDEQVVGGGGGDGGDVKSIGTTNFGLKDLEFQIMQMMQYGDIDVSICSNADPFLS